MVRSNVDADGWEQIEQALEPPNAIDPTTGLPWAWGGDDDNDLDALVGVVT